MVDTEKDFYKLLWNIDNSGKSWYHINLSQMLYLSNQMSCENSMVASFAVHLHALEFSECLSNCLRSVYGSFDEFMDGMSKKGFVSFVKDVHRDSFRSDSGESRLKLITTMNEWLTRLESGVYLDIGGTNTDDKITIFSYNATDPQNHLGAVAKLWFYIVLPLMK